MDLFDKISADAKKAWAASLAQFATIQSKNARIAVATFAALLVLMVVWAVLPWIGFILAVAVIALIVRAFWPEIGK